jgi:hypothetical protein
VEARRPITLAAACAVHASALLALEAVKSREPVERDLEPEAVDLTLDEFPQDDKPRAATPIRAHVIGGLAKAAGELDPARAKVTSSVASTEENRTIGSERSEPGAVSPPTDWSFSPTEGASPTSPRFGDLVVPSLGNESTPPSTSTTGGVAEGLAAHDVALGLGRGGPILAAAELAARSNDAPMQGGATFEVSVRTDGTVSARVVTADGDVAGWTEVADVLARTLDPKGVRVPSGRQGVVVVVRVDAKVQFADGRDVRSLHGPQMSLAPSVLQSALEGKLEPRGGSTAGPRAAPREADVSGTEPPPPVGALGSRPSQGAVVAGAAQALGQRVLPAPTISVSGKICSASLSVTPLGVGIGGGCSFVNIGTGTTRVVSGRIVSEGVF